MYDSSTVAEMIKKTALSRNIQMKTVLSTLNLNKNTLSNMYNGSMLRSDNLARIADYLGCSVDYLLGRTDEPSLSTNVIGGDVAGGTVVQGAHHSSVVVHNGGERTLTDEEAELLRLFNVLDVRRRMKLLDLAFVLEEETKSE